VLVALDGTVRGFAVLSGAMDLVRGIGGTVGVVSVDTATDDEGSDLPTGRTQRLVDGVKQLMASRDLGRGTWNSDGGRGEPAIRIPRGQVVEEVLREVAQTGTNILVVGYRRGGPAAVIEAGSIARRLVHEAPCAILTIPL
jgi:nucleotide-binding universal stress UspA family protein